MATFWAMLNNEKTIGSTLHYIRDKGIDTGDVITIDTINVDYSKTYLGNVLRLYQQGIISMANAVKHIEQHKVCPTSVEQENAGSYYGFPTEEQCQAFKNKGLALFNYDEIVELASQFQTNQ